jgi:hypothetical protein
MGSSDHRFGLGTDLPSFTKALLGTFTNYRRRRSHCLLIALQLILRSLLPRTQFVRCLFLN